MTDELSQKLDALIRLRDPKGSAVLEKNDYVARFSAGGKPQELRIQYVPQHSWTLAYTAALPGAKARWFLESKWVWFPEHPGCKRLKLAALDGKYKLFASDEAFFREVFGGKNLVDVLMQFPGDNHYKASLRDGTLRMAWKVRFNPRLIDRDATLLAASAVLLQHGVDCFSSVQLACLTRGEISTFFP
jgi:hypothetical protein